MNTAEKGMQPTGFVYKGFEILLSYSDHESDRGWAWTAMPFGALMGCRIGGLRCDRGDSYEGAIAAARQEIDRRLHLEMVSRESELMAIRSCFRREEGAREIAWRDRRRTVVKTDGGFVALTPESGAALPGVYAELAGAIAAYEIDLAALDYAALDKDEPSLTLDDLRFYWSKPYGCADVNLSREQVEVILQKAIAIASTVEMRSQEVET